MEVIHTHPTNALQAKAFTAPGSLSFPTGHSELTPPVETTGASGSQEQSFGSVSDLSQAGADSASVLGAEVTPATPVATPVAMHSGSGLTPTLQYVPMS